jgi:hypothetical protein
MYVPRVSWVRLRPTSSTPLAEIVAMVTAHWAYHAGEINAILAIRREEAWEYGEEVEENHIATSGHAVKPAWMSDEQGARCARGGMRISGPAKRA